MNHESKALRFLLSELGSRLVKIEDEIHRRGLKTIRGFTLIARDPDNDDMFVCVTNETSDGLQKATALALNQNHIERPQDPLYVAVGYNAEGSRTLLAIKATQDEAKTVIRRWAESFASTDIEEWRIGDELGVQDGH